MLSVDLVVAQLGDESGLFVDLGAKVRIEAPVARRHVARLQQFHHLRTLVLLQRQQQQQQQHPVSVVVIRPF